MKMAVFSTRPYDKRFLEEAKLRLKEDSTAEFVYFEASLDLQTATLAQGCEAVCVFVNDQLDAPVLQALHAMGVRAVLLRCAGFNNIDLVTAKALDFFVAHVPAYSPEAVAEHTLALVMTLNRQTHRAYNRVREGNFMLNGLLGRTLHGKTVGWSGWARSGWRLRVFSRGWAAMCWATIPIPHLASKHSGSGSNWRRCSHARISSRCTAR